MTNKEKHEKNKEYQSERNKRISEKLERQRANLKDLQEANTAKAIVIPKGDPMNPTKEQRAALIEKIEAKRYYKDENLHQVPKKQTTY